VGGCKLSKNLYVQRCTSERSKGDITISKGSHMQKNQKKRRNPKHKNYDYEYSMRLVKKNSKICAFYRGRGHVITKCPWIDSEMRDGFIRHVGQKMLNINFVGQPQMRK